MYQPSWKKKSYLGRREAYWRLWSTVSVWMWCQSHVYLSGVLDIIERNIASLWKLFGRKARRDLAANSSEDLRRNMVNFEGKFRRIQENCGARWRASEIPYGRTVVTNRLHSEAPDEISECVETDAADFRNCVTAASRKHLHHAGRRLGFALYLLPEIVQRMLQGIFACVILLGVIFRSWICTSVDWTRTNSSVCETQWWTYALTFIYDFEKGMQYFDMFGGPARTLTSS